MPQIIAAVTLTICTFIVVAKIMEHRKINRFSVELAETIDKILKGENPNE